jgi:hypothetical protein
MTLTVAMIPFRPRLPEIATVRDLFDFDRGAAGAEARTPSQRSASPKPRRRQTQADVAPNPNPCQLFPIAAHCRFKPFQGLGRSRKGHSPLAAPARPRENSGFARDNAKFLPIPNPSPAKQIQARPSPSAFAQRASRSRAFVFRPARLCRVHSGYRKGRSWRPESYRLRGAVPPSLPRSEGKSPTFGGFSAAASRALSAALSLSSHS